MSALTRSCSIGAFTTSPPEPKSIHTWFDSGKTEISNYDVDVRISAFPQFPDRQWLYYFSLQVTFTDYDEWGHGGLQWAGNKEFQTDGNRGVNWGGGSNWAGYGGNGVNNTPFTWQVGRWYRYRVLRVDQDARGLRHWLFAVLDYDTGSEQKFGTIWTKSEWIINAMVFTETGYGVHCDSERAKVDWRNPVFRCTEAGEFCPQSGTANYNGTCTGQHNTEQGLISRSPLVWFHSTNAPRTVNPYDRLW
jgi:hypothetical protein